MTEYVDLLDKLAEGRELPSTCDSWAIKSTRPDLTTKNGYRWPFPGKWARTTGPFTQSADPCPSRDGDGLCVAKTWDGMASGGFPARTLLLVAYAEKDVLSAAGAGGKLRVKCAKVVDLIDGEALLRECGARANLTGANLYGANLIRANLTRANLTGANLYGANLIRANLTGADLTGADLTGASLTGANLTGANLTEADLYGADLTRAIGYRA